MKCVTFTPDKVNWYLNRASSHSALFSQKRSFDKPWRTIFVDLKRQNAALTLTRSENAISWKEQQNGSED